jgi:hypothetical protein
MPDKPLKMPIRPQSSRREIVDQMNRAFECGLPDQDYFEQSERNVSIDNIARISEGLLRPGFVSHPLTYIICGKARGFTSSSLDYSTLQTFHGIIRLKLVLSGPRRLYEFG